LCFVQGFGTLLNGLFGALSGPAASV